MNNCKLTFTTESGFNIQLAYEPKIPDEIWRV